MIKNYLKTAWRSLVHNRLYSLLNVTGLSIALAACFLLLLYVYQEYTYDHNNGKLSRIYQVYTNFKDNNEWSTGVNTPVRVAEVLKKDFPAVEQAAVRSDIGKKVFSQEDQFARLETTAASVSLFGIFSFEFLEGSPGTISADASSVILSRSAAKKLFGNEKAIGRTVRYDNNRFLKVAAVIADLPANTSLQFDALLPWETYTAGEQWVKDDGWYNYNYTTYLLAKKKADIETLNKGVSSILLKYDGNKDNKLFVYPLSDAHLYNEFKNGVPEGGQIRLVRLMLIMACSILLMGCINFMNMSTARSVKRAREVGVRRTIGAGRSSLVMQFMGESLLIAIIGLLFAAILTVLLLPVFNRLLQLQLSIPYHQPAMWFAIIGITIFAGVAAGSYPAFFLSSFRPVRVLKGNITGVGKASVRPRQVLVVVQFTFAICLILSSIVVYRQVHYAKARPLGYNNKGLIELLPEGNLEKNFETFRQEAIKENAIVDGAISASGINNSDGTTWGVTWPGQLAGEEKMMIRQMATSYHFMATMGLQLKEGRDFSEAYPADSTAIILNEAAVKMMRLEQPLGQLIKWQGMNRHVVGIVKDFSYNNPFDLSKPMVIGFKKDWIGNITLRLNPALPVSESLTKLEQLLKKMNPGYPFDYTFLDAAFAKKFQSEQMLGDLALVFTILSIMISCLGLFGLAAFSVEQRQKEIGIRKVLGASISSIWFHLSGEFVGLVIIAFIVGAAASGYMMKQWLLKYEYHTTVNIVVLIATFLLALLICLVTVGFQAVKAAIANPVKALRSE